MSNFFTDTLLRNIFKYLYKISHHKSFNHNRRYWPYFKVIRDQNGYLNQVFYKNKKLQTIQHNINLIMIPALLLQLDHLLKL